MLSIKFISVLIFLIGEFPDESNLIDFGWITDFDYLIAWFCVETIFDLTCWFLIP